MKAIFIDSVNRTVTEIQIENALHAFYKKIGCRLIQMLDIGESHALCVDEEGKLRDWKAGFRLAGSSTLAGNALIVGTDDDGNFTDCRAPLCLFERNVEFIDLSAHSLPPPRFVAVPIKGELTTENIEKAKAEAFRQREE